MWRLYSSGDDQHVPIFIVRLESFLLPADASIATLFFLRNLTIGTGMFQWRPL